ncbi:hypothetical protein [Teredinibacter turnerae]|uniref:hypothetical protein n=1 Tax=Teredinibacter turnerae TaxID=2426 RepID=UPI0030CD68B5
MRDQEIYKEIGQRLFEEVGSISETVHLAARVFIGENVVDKIVWAGVYLDANSGVRLSNQTSLALHKLIVALNEYYKAESMGKWNLMLYKLAPLGKSFSIDFEFNEEIESGKLTLYRYRKRFEPPKH